MNLTKIETISRNIKEEKYHQRSKVFWFLGLSGAGKSTLAQIIEKKLFDLDYKVVLLDGDNIRSGINNNLSFSEDDRKENIRRISEISKLFIDNGIIVLNCFITPTEEMREIPRTILGDDYIEIFVNSPLSVCEKRDIKGLYKKARKGEIKNFTGIDSIFETPTKSNIIIDTTLHIDVCVDEILDEILYRIEL